MYLRRSFKIVERVSDITIADFWGINEILPQVDDDKGISLIFIQNNKSKSLINKVKK